MMKADEELFDIIEEAFSEHVEAEGWLDNGTPMATIRGKADFMAAIRAILTEEDKDVEEERPYYERSCGY